jgi:hypothetical protein
MTNERVAEDARKIAIANIVGAASNSLKKGAKSLETTKKVIRGSKKPRMRTVASYLCDQCDVPIQHPDQGFVIHGNIYTADTTCRGGVIGNNFPDVQPGDKIEVGDVKETVLCLNCFSEALGVDISPQQFDIRLIDEKFSKLTEEQPKDVPPSMRPPHMTASGYARAPSGSYATSSPSYGYSSGGSSRDGI